jgi:hypothetical protein
VPVLDVRRMRVLREVAVHGTIAAAATALDFTPSAGSQQIAALGRDPTFTPAGSTACLTFRRSCSRPSPRCSRGSAS